MINISCLISRNCDVYIWIHALYALATNVYRLHECIIIHIYNECLSAMVSCESVR
jgi:hypothetical protein